MAFFTFELFNSVIYILFRILNLGKIIGKLYSNSQCNAKFGEFQATNLLIVLKHYSDM